MVATAVPASMNVAMTASWAAPTNEGACAVTDANQTAAATAIDDAAPLAFWGSITGTGAVKFA